MGTFMDELAPNTGQTWSDVLAGSQPMVAGDGTLAGPWRDAISAAVSYELANPDWSNRFSDGPVGQVIDAMGEMGYGDFQEAANQTEGALRSSPQPAVFGAPMMGSPGQMEMSPALSCLAMQSSIEVNEKANWFEAITAIIGQEIEMANKYKVFAGGTEEELFFAVEQTDCCTRQLKQCCPDCAPWNLHILYTQGGANTKAFELNRAFSCTCCCFNRPVVEVIDASSGQKLGSIQDPYACCDLTFTMKGPDDNPAIAAKGGCCQWGLCCPLPCGPCSEVNFSLVDAQSGSEVGNLQKKVPGCCKFFLAPDVDNYKVDFGAVTDPRWKALVMALTIFIDFRYFSENPNDDNGGLMGAMTTE